MECKRCKYVWKSRVDEPKQCPNCKQYYYNKPREWERKIDVNNDHQQIVNTNMEENKKEESHVENKNSDDKTEVTFY